MTVYVQDLLYSLMFLMLLEISPAEEGEKDLFQNRKAPRVPCNGTGATSTTWRRGKFQLHMREKRSIASAVRPRSPQRLWNLHPWMHSNWICFGQEARLPLPCCLGIPVFSLSSVIKPLETLWSGVVCLEFTCFRGKGSKAWNIL